MNKMKTSLIAAVVITAAGITSAATAEMVGGVGYSSLSEDGIRLGTIQGTLGYKLDTSSNFSLIPEFRAGFGVNDDSVLGAKIEVDRFYGVNLRGQWEGEQTYFFFAPSYTNVKLDASALGTSVSSNDWELGAGIGAGWRFNDNASIEASYEYFDGTDIIGVGLRFEF